MPYTQSDPRSAAEGPVNKHQFAPAPHCGEWRKTVVGLNLAFDVELYCLQAVAGSPCAANGFICGFCESGATPGETVREMETDRECESGGGRRYRIFWLLIN